MKKILNFIKIIVIFTIIYYIFYKIFYIFINEYIFPYRFKDDWDSILKSMLLSSFLAIIITIFISVNINKKLIKTDKKILKEKVGKKEFIIGNIILIIIPIILLCLLWYQMEKIIYNFPIFYGWIVDFIINNWWIIDLIINDLTNYNLENIKIEKFKDTIINFIIYIIITYYICKINDKIIMIKILTIFIIFSLSIGFLRVLF